MNASKSTVIGVLVLTGTAVNEMFGECKVRDGEDSSKFLKAKVAGTEFLISPSRLDNHAQDLVGFLKQLPDAAQKTKKGLGMTLDDLIKTSLGKTWPGDMNQVHALIAMGICSGYMVEVLEPAAAAGAAPVKWVPKYLVQDDKFPNV